MNFSANTRHIVRTAGTGLVLSAALLGCGGGDSSAVLSLSLSVPKYSQSMVLTVNGISTPVAVAATGCTGLTLSTTAPYISTATTAYYTCTATSLGAGQFVATRVSDAAVLATQAFTVPLPQVTMTFSNGAAVSGSMVWSLAADKTPITVTNFLNYVNSGFYVGTVIHRVAPGFVIQGGGFVAPIVDASGPLKATNPPIKLEVGKGLSNLQWTVAMARFPGPDTATSQFFINLVDNSAQLDPNPSAVPPLPGYAVFGAVMTNTALVALIAADCTPVAPATECTPIPNVVITAAVQTQ